MKTKKFPGVEVRGETTRIYFQYLGQRRRITTGFDGTKVEGFKNAVQLLKRIKAEISAGIFNLDDYCPTKADQGESAIRTFQEVADDFLNGKSHLAKGTRMKYSQYAAIWARRFAGWNWKDFTYPNLRKSVSQVNGKRLANPS